MAEEIHGRFSNIVEDVWKKYEEILKRDSALDFDDLLLKTRDLLRDDETVRSRYREKWEYIHVDEYQDTNRVQYDIAKMLAGKDANICAVGDIDQNIYSWRGANIKNILDFEKDYPEANVVILEENYRSTKTILEAANIVIEKNKLRREKNLFTNNKDGERIGVFHGFDEASEAEFIALKTKELINSKKEAEEIAVLYRANFQSRALEEAFIRNSVPYQLLGIRFFERKEVKDILSYLRLALNPESLSDLKRAISTPSRGIGKATIAKICLNDEGSLSNAMQKKIKVFRDIINEIGKRAEKEPPSKIIKFIIEASGLEEEWRNTKTDEGEARLENAYELLNFASKYDDLEPKEGILAFMAETALQSDQDEIKENAKSVRLMTIHASKGLEFDVVFVSGLEDGLFPHQRMTKEGISPEESEEERRLFYVALTRAREKIFLTYAETRTIFGRREVNIPSEFIFDIPEEYTEEENFGDSGGYRKPLLDIEF